MPASAIARATVSPAASPPRTDMQRALRAALDGVAQRVEGAAADILAHRAGVGRAGHEGAGHLAAPVDMGAADGEDFGRCHVDVRGVAQSRRTLGRRDAAGNRIGAESAAAARPAPAIIGRSVAGRIG